MWILVSFFEVHLQNLTRSVTNFFGSLHRLTMNAFTCPWSWAKGKWIFLPLVSTLWWKPTLAWKWYMTGRPSSRSLFHEASRMQPLDFVGAIMAILMMTSRPPVAIWSPALMTLATAGPRGTLFVRWAAGTDVQPAVKWKVSGNPNSCAAWSLARVGSSPGATAKSAPSSSTRTACLTPALTEELCKLHAAGCRIMPVLAKHRALLLRVGETSRRVVSRYFL